MKWLKKNALWVALGALAFIGIILLIYRYWLQGVQEQEKPKSDLLEPWQYTEDQLSAIRQQGRRMLDNIRSVWADNGGVFDDDLPGMMHDHYGVPYIYPIPKGLFIAVQNAGGPEEINPKEFADLYEEHAKTGLYQIEDKWRSAGSKDSQKKPFIQDTADYYIKGYKYPGELPPGIMQNVGGGSTPGTYYSQA